jgi:hypothetical protein
MADQNAKQDQYAFPSMLAESAATGEIRRVKSNDAGELLASLAGGTLVPEEYDYISIPSYDANNNPLTVVYKLGGAGGTTVATLTLTYSGTNLSTVTRT